MPSFVEIKAGMRVAGQYKRSGRAPSPVAIEVSAVIDPEDRGETMLFGTIVEGSRVGAVSNVYLRCFQPGTLKVEDIPDFEPVDPAGYLMSPRSRAFDYLEPVRDADELAWGRHLGGHLVSEYVVEKGVLMTEL